MRFDEKGDKISTVTLYKFLQFSDETRKIGRGKDSSIRRSALNNTQDAETKDYR